MRHLYHGQYQIDHLRIDGGPGHAVVFGIFRCLHQGDAALFLDSRQAHRTVRASAGQYQAEGPLLVHIGQVSEEQINGNMYPGRPIRWRHRQITIVHHQVVRRRDDIHGVLFDGDGLGHLPHRHFGDFLNDPIDLAGIIGRQVKNNDEGHAVVMRHVLEK
ncbi:hypothetical protein D3C76_1111360 [compost metagenome]